MRRVTIVVIGNGKSTRANVEALIADVADSVDEAMVATVYDTKQSEGQVWAEQWAIDKDIPTFKCPDNDYDSLFAENDLDDIKFFLLWDDEDPACQLAAATAQQYGVPAFDLAEGLIGIDLSRKTIEEPATPPAHDIIEELPALISVEEVLAEPEPEEESVETETVELDNGESLEYTVERMTIDEMILDYIDGLADAITEKILERLKNANEKD